MLLRACRFLDNPLTCFVKCHKCVRQRGTGYTAFFEF